MKVHCERIPHSLLQGIFKRSLAFIFFLVWALASLKGIASSEPLPEGKPILPYWLKENYAGDAYYFRQDHGYYHPMIADIRLPLNTLRYYRADAVPFTQSGELSPHHFADVTFGETFYLLGFDYAQPENAAKEGAVKGWAAFVEGSAHMLLDFNAPSRDVINTDYRLGAGLTGRGLPWGKERSWDRHLSWKMKYFHESTHLGDEYSIAAQKKFLSGDPSFAGFRRINVSYEAAEFFLALDGKRLNDSPGPEYGRLYAGYRLLNDPGYTTDDPPPLTSNINNSEWQFGGEVYFRWSESFGAASADSRHFYQQLYRPQFIFLAADSYKREQYDYRGNGNDLPRWSLNTVVGILYGDPFLGENTLRYYFNYYSGLNPHGQFRETKIHYLGFNIGFDFK